MDSLRAYNKNHGQHVADSKQENIRSLPTAYSLLSTEKGIALVMVLILAVICLAIVSALLFMTTQGTIISGSQKFYKTAKEASLGGAEISTEYLSGRGTLALTMITSPAGGFGVGCNCADPRVTTDNIDLSTGARSCRCDKLCNATADWDASCDEGAAAGMQVGLNAKTDPDFVFTFGDSGFRVFTKIVDTVLGNTDVGGIVASNELGGRGVVDSALGIANPLATPYLYRLEVQAEAINNPRERSRISLLYGY